MHAKRRPIVLLLLLLLLLLPAACARAPQAPADPNLDLSDPNVGGGAGESLGPETPIPTPTITREPSPRLDAGAATAGAYADDGRQTTDDGQTAATPPPFVLATPLPPSAVVATITTLATPDAAAPTEPPTATATATPTAEGERIHVVQPGENLYRIGLQYGLSWVAIAEYNGITNPDAISAGQELRIPPSPTATPTATVEAERDDGRQTTDDGQAADGGRQTTDDGEAVVATVAAGDTLYAIARQYGVDWAQIAEANGLATPNQLYPGQPLKIPPDVAGPAPAFSHRVHSGETLGRLAAQYGLPAGELAEANGLAAPYTIYAGQLLTIPGDE